MALLHCQPCGKQLFGDAPWRPNRTHRVASGDHAARGSRRAARLGLGAVLGYLAEGLAIGPFGLRMFTQPAAILQIAELGSHNC